ncbi:hypothetical protein CDAR_492431 [Caerostris darwini]|uniref:Uncharacterized protein n=1 Tax=Caerostris darwini TaxID=1538125 RepID=A0AAV4UZK0_9ARAC|nr:hypothetical protein CDAR_492431 [Caerostris darwini]
MNLTSICNKRDVTSYVLQKNGRSYLNRYPENTKTNMKIPIWMIFVSFVLIFVIPHSLAQYYNGRRNNRQQQPPVTPDPNAICGGGNGQCGQPQRFCSMFGCNCTPKPVIRIDIQKIPKRKMKILVWMVFASFILIVIPHSLAQNDNGGRHNRRPGPPAVPDPMCGGGNGQCSQPQRFCGIYGCGCTPKPGSRCCDGYRYDRRTGRCREILRLSLTSV